MKFEITNLKVKCKVDLKLEQFLLNIIIVYCKMKKKILQALNLY